MTEIKQLTFERDVIYSDLEGMLQFLQDECLDTDQFMCRAQDLTHLKNDFTRIQTKLEKLHLKNDTFNSEFELENRNKFKDLYYTAKSSADKLKLEQKLKQQSTPASNQSGNYSQNCCHTRPKMNLPPLPLPQFHGHTTEWAPFYDLFQSVVHNNESLNDVERYRYLLLSLRGEPYNLIKSLPIIGQNYQVALDKLINRYENKRLIATNHIDRLLDMEPMSNNPLLNEQGIRSILNTYHVELPALKVMNFPVQEWNFLLFNILLRKLSPQIRERFEQTLNSSSTIPHISDLLDFLEKELNTSVILKGPSVTSPPKLERSTFTRVSTVHPSAKPSVPATARRARSYPPRRSMPALCATTAHNTSAQSPTTCCLATPQLHQRYNVATQRKLFCSYCQSNAHSLNKCSDFLNLSILQRKDFISNKNICSNCLIPGHTVLQCYSRFNCQICQQRHHTSLHINTETLANLSNEEQPTSNIAVSAAVSCTSAASADGSQGLLCDTKYSVLLATALVDIRPRGSTSMSAHTIRALIDPGSQTSLITEACVQRLGLKRHSAQSIISITGVGGAEAVHPHGVISCDVTPHNQLKPAIGINALVISKITNYTPQVHKVNNATLSHIRNLTLADPEFSSARPVELLLGADYSDVILLDDNIRGPHGAPVAIKTIFGYVLSGKISTTSSTTLNVCVTSFQTDANIQRFWELESVPATKTLSPDEALCESIFVDTHTRDSSGRYSVSLPFKPNVPPLGESRDTALFRFKKLETRLFRNSCLQQDYNRCLQEYVDLGHMQLIPPSSETLPVSERYYLPHHCVVKTQSTTTKTRVVFDASCPTTNGRSLNDNLLTGPKLQQDIVMVLLKISNIKLPRHVLPTTYNNIQIHGFSDASEKAYSACVYIRTTTTDSIQTHLLIAKTKVAPVKRISLPRLELCGALLLSKLMKVIIDTYQNFLNIDNVYAWSDSSIVLAWLHSPSQDWKVFVSNRVTEITERIPSARWRHVRSADNPADAASRGVLPSQLDRDLWFYGPTWLRKSEIEWPQLLQTYNTTEEKRTYTHLNVLVVDKNISINDILQKYSNLGKLLRIVSYIFRFYHRCRKSTKFNKTYTNNFITIPELNFTLQRFIFLTQQEMFSNEIACVKQNKPCTKHIQKLKPFIDDAGFLRVGGRINHSKLDYEAKHQILLPKSNILTNLLIDHFHKLNLHVGPQTLQFLLSQRYWIVSARNEIRKRTSRCLQCFRVKPTAPQPPMAPLPEVRVSPRRPFLHVGIDYAGPFQTKTIRLRNSKTFKSYVCIFVCLSTKAVHLELVPDLTTQAFISALRRFTARRGLCSDIYSDNGRNFVGCNSYLREMYAFLRNNKSDIERQSVDLKINWHFQPAYASHFGGIWEAGVKSFKQHLFRVVGSQILTYDEFNTLLCQIEAVLNSRPLCVLSSDPSDPLPITPAHFLVGGPLTSLPEHDWSDSQTNRLLRWQLLQQMLQHYWKRWSREYLQQLQQRGKWYHNKTPPITEGSIVLLHNDALPPMQWQLARVHQVHPGHDGVVRVVTLRVGNSYTKRPVVKVYPLPIDD